MKPRMPSMAWGAAASPWRPRCADAAVGAGRRLAAALLGACALLGGGFGVDAAHAAAIVHDDRGHAIALAGEPQRIVTLLPSLTESVCELGACARLVGVDRYSNWPAPVQALPHLGGQDDAQIERIVALKPDLVLAAVSARVVDRLEALGIPVVALEAKRLVDIHRVLTTIAQVLGRPGAGDAAWARIQVRVTQAAARVPASWHGKRVYFEIASNPYAAGESSFIGETLASLGVGNIVPASLGPFPKLSPEFVVREQPDLIMAEVRNLAEMPNRPGWNRLRALDQGRQCGFAPQQYDILVRPGPRLGEAAELMADCLARVAPPSP